MLELGDGALRFRGDEGSSGFLPGHTTVMRAPLGTLAALHRVPDGVFLEGDHLLVRVTCADVPALLDAVVAAVLAADPESCAWEHGESLAFGRIERGGAVVDFRPRLGPLTHWGTVVAIEGLDDRGRAGRRWVLRRMGAEPVIVRMPPGLAAAASVEGQGDLRECVRVRARISVRGRRRAAGLLLELDDPVLVDVSRRGVALEAGPGPRMGDLVELEVAVDTDSATRERHRLSGRIVSVLQHGRRVRLGVFVPESSVGRLFDQVQRDVLRRRAGIREDGVG